MRLLLTFILINSFGLFSQTRIDSIIKLNKQQATSPSLLADSIQTFIKKDFISFDKSLTTDTSEKIIGLKSFQSKELKYVFDMQSFLFTRFTFDNSYNAIKYFKVLIKKTNCCGSDEETVDLYNFKNLEHIRSESLILLWTGNEIIKILSRDELGRAAIEKYLENNLLAKHHYLKMKIHKGGGQLTWTVK